MARDITGATAATLEHLTKGYAEALSAGDSEAAFLALDMLLQEAEAQKELVFFAEGDTDA